MRAYHDIVREVFTRGTRKPNRTGVDTLSAFNVNYALEMDAGFPLLTTKRIDWKNIVVENLWFLTGERHIGLLRRHGCRFWDPWADDEGHVPSAYGHYWRHFPVTAGADATRGEPAATNDQVRYVLDELARNPASRRLVISAWEPANAQASALPPCHLLFIFNVQRDADGEPRLCLHLTQRSCDVALGVPYNIAGYALLLHLFARFSGLRPGTLAHTLVDAHIYTAKPDGSMAEYDHVPGLREQLARAPRPLPRLDIADDIRSLDDLLALRDADTATLFTALRIDGYDPHPPLRFKVAV